MSFTLELAIESNARHFCQTQLFSIKVVHIFQCNQLFLFVRTEINGQKSNQSVNLFAYNIKSIALTDKPFVGLVNKSQNLFKNEDIGPFFANT